MKTQRKTVAARRGASAFTLVEVLVSMALFAMGFVSLYAGIASGIQIIEVARENLRATQVMVEKTETMRLYSWDQVISGTNIPTRFTDSFYPQGLGGGQGITYYGTVAISNVSFSSTYSKDLRLVTIEVRWTNFNIPRFRQMHTYIAQNGLQNYIF